MKIHAIPVSEIVIQPNRQRQEIPPDKVAELAASIDQIGLIQPVVVRPDGNHQFILVAGERRMKALDFLWNFGGKVHCGTQLFPENYVPCLLLSEVDDLTAFEIELEENIRREDLTWQERSRATSRLNELRRLQAQKAGLPEPRVSDLAQEIMPEGGSIKTAINSVSRDLILARHLDDSDVANAKTADEGIKILKRKEETRRSAALGESVGRTFSASDHSLIKGDCLEIIQPWTYTGPQFDCILTDPPYGINAQNFSNSAGRAAIDGHSYDDSLDTWTSLMQKFTLQSFAIAKPQAHLYIFCDIDNFSTLREFVRAAGWTPFRTPVVWHNPSSQRTPWPQSGPMRRYQICLFAKKGDRSVLKLSPDVITYASDSNLGWAAQKPIELYKDLLSRSCRPGDSVLDPFCGTGTIFAAGNALKVKATGIELDPVAYGIAASRIKELK
jgi:DNA modification methylase